MRERVYSLDVLRVFAMFMVLLNHTFAEEITNTSATGIHMVLAIGSMIVSRTGVPIFLMLSGALHLKKSEIIDCKSLYLKRIPKVLIPFVVWSLIYFVIYDVIRDHNATVHSLTALIFLPGKAGHLWYMYLILALYIFLPVFQGIVKSLNKSNIEYLLIIWILASGVLHYLKELSVPGIRDFYANLHLLKGLWGYYLLGWYLSAYRPKINKGIIFFGIMALYASLYVALYLYIRTKAEFCSEIISYSGLPIILISAGIFILIESCETLGKCAKVKNIVVFLSCISFGVYLNQFIARGIAGNIVSRFIGDGIISLLMLFIFTSIISIVMSAIVYMLPNTWVGKKVKLFLGS